MNIRAGKEIVRQETETGAGDRNRDEARGRRSGQALGDGEQVGIGEERKGPNTNHARGQPVQAVDEVHSVGAEHDEEDRDRYRCGAVKGDDLVW